jgi:ADP-ribosylglycohydrolase
MPVTIPKQKDKCRGAMLGTAIGDALGWPNERRSKNKEKLPSAKDRFVEWTRRNNKPCYHDEKILAGEYSDDTQLTLSVARSIIAGNWEEYLVKKELPYWLEYERGGGSALLKAARICKKGVLPWQARNTRDYFNAGGNGTVMRILPHVIAHTPSSGIDDLIDSVILDAIITHGHPRAILGATCYAYTLYYLLKKDSVLEYGELVAAVINGEKFWGSLPSKDRFALWLDTAQQHNDFDYSVEWTQVLSNMIKQLDYIKNSLKQGILVDDKNVMTELGCFSKENGAGDVAILTAVFLASKYANNPELGIKVPAFSVGADTDTIASITGALLGMLSGLDWIPFEWRMVQDYDCLVRVTDLLLAKNSLQAAKDDLAEVKKKEFDWINKPIGRMRKIGTSTIRSGNYAIVTITKWETTLGQTLYTKEMQKIDSLPSVEKKGKTIQQTLYDDLSESTHSQSKNELLRIGREKVVFASTKPLEEIDVTVKDNRRFLLDEHRVAQLLKDEKFRDKVTIGKVLKVILALMEGKETSENISKKFSIDIAMVELIKKNVV